MCAGCWAFAHGFCSRNCSSAAASFCRAGNLGVLAGRLVRASGAGRFGTSDDAVGASAIYVECILVSRHFNLTPSR